MGLVFNPLNNNGFNITGPGGGGGGGSASFKDPVTTFSALPSIGNTDGDVRATLDTSVLYVWSSGSSTWNPQGATSGYNVQLVTLNSSQISAKNVTLTGTPTNSNLTQLTVIGGPAQDYGTDFTVSGSTLSWSGLFLDGILAVNDKLIIIFN